MAKIKNQVISGKLGDVIYKSWNGEPYVVAAPPFKESQCESHLYCKHSFGICGKLGGSMYKIKVLRDHWEKSDVKAFSARNKFTKINYTRILKFKNLSGVILVNETNPHPVILKSSSLSEDGLTCAFGISPVSHLCKDISLQGIVLLTEPSDACEEKCFSFPFVSENYNLVNSDEITLSTGFTSQDIEMSKRYNNKNVLLNLAFKDLQGEVVKFSETFYKD